MYLGTLGNVFRYIQKVYLKSIFKILNPATMQAHFAYCGYTDDLFVSLSGFSRAFLEIDFTAVLVRQIP